METKERTVITVSNTVNAPVEKVWDYWTKPEHITKWNYASDDWHTPWAKKPDGDRTPPHARRFARPAAATWPASVLR